MIEKKIESIILAKMENQVQNIPNHNQLENAIADILRDKFHLSVQQQQQQPQSPAETNTQSVLIATH